MNEQVLKVSKNGKYELMFSGTNYYYFYEIVNGKEKCIDEIDVLNFIFDRKIALDMFDCIDNYGLDYFLTKSEFVAYFEPEKSISEAHNLPDKFKDLLKSWEEVGNSKTEFFWYVKNAEIKFRYKYQRYSLMPWDINCSSEQFEHVSRKIEEDLKNIGATDIRYLGMMD